MTADAPTLTRIVLDAIAQLIERDIPKARKAADDLLTGARLTGDVQTIGAALCRRGFAERLLGLRLEALATLQEAVNVLVSGEDSPWLAEAHLQLASAYGTGQEMDLGVSHLDEAERCFRAVGDTAGLLRVQVVHATNLGIADRDAEAVAQFQVCDEAYKSLSQPDYAGHGMCLFNLGVALRAVDRAGEARPVLERCLAVARRGGSLRIEALALGQLAKLAHAEGHRDEGIRCATEAIGLARQVGYASGAASASLFLASLAEEEGRPDEAEQLIRTAHEEASAAGASYTTTWLEEEWSALCERRGDLRGALEHYRAYHTGRIALITEVHSHSVQHRQAQHLIALARKHGQSLEAEITERSAEMALTAARLRAEVERRERAEAEYLELSRVDPMTGCLRRHCLIPLLQTLLTRQASVAVLSIDLEGFNTLNEACGHAVGDAVLGTVGERLRRLARGAPVVRYGGDEFVVVLEGPEAGGPHEAATAIAAALGQPLIPDERGGTLGCSIGIANTGPTATTPEQLLLDAELALQHAKRAGLRIAHYSADLGARFRRVQAVRRELRGVVARDELCLHYQPIIATVSGITRGYEALLRWHSPELGAVMPDEFIPEAEHTGAIVAMGDWVLHAACRQAAALAANGSAATVSLNVSPLQLEGPGFGQRVLDACAQAGLGPGQLQIEITETAAAAGLERARDCIETLAREGIPTFLDDFGAGHSNLARIIELPLGGIKIDRSLTAAIGESARAERVIATLIHVAHGVGLSVVAEGVETAAQLRWLADAGCALAQGYHIGRPAPAGQAFPPGGAPAWRPA